MSRQPPTDASTSGMKGRGYYDAHSEYQRRVIEGGDQMIRSLVHALDLDRGGHVLRIADYGAGTGGTSVHAVKTAITAVRERDSETPVLAIHSDLPTNDFSQLFRIAAGRDGYLRLDGGPIYAAAAAGSFFNQVVPSESVDIGMCSNASHWFRDQPQVRIAEGIYFPDARGDARRTLAEIAAADWLSFLEARSLELVVGGRLLIQGIASVETGEGEPERISAAKLLRVMGEVAETLVGDGMLDRELLDRYVFPVYCRTTAESTAPLSGCGQLENAFEVASTTIEEVPNPYWEAFLHDGDAEAYAKAYIEFVRAFAESTMVAHLFEPGAIDAAPEDICEEYFDRLRAATAAKPEAGLFEAWVLRLELVRR